MRPSGPTLWAALCAAAAPLAAAAAPTPVAPVVVIAATPLPGTGVDIDKTPANTQTLSADDLARDGSPSATGALADQLASVNISDNLDDPFQPDILYRGFEASPVLGTPEGLTVYENGVRINEAFGDTLNWDLIPDIAIRRLDVVGSDPVFGLNTLGGAIVVATKTGFTDPGGEAEVGGGSFGRREAWSQFGASSGNVAVYLAARALGDDGWREFSPSALGQAFADITRRAGRLTLDLSLTAADNTLDGESAAPVQELAVNRALVFTSPQSNADQLGFATLNGDYAASATLSFQAALYARSFRQSVENGNTTAYAACAASPNLGRLCQSDGATPLAKTSGGAIPDISDGGTIPIGENDQEQIRTLGLGGSIQATSSARLLSRDNRVSVGASLDSASTRFVSDTEVGVIDPALEVLPSEFVVDTSENTPFSATPVSLEARSTYYGIWATDTLDVTHRLAVTASGRFNLATIDLVDQRGSELDGRSRYQRLNPALGFTYKVDATVTAYAGWSQGARAPSPSEIECSNPLRPCLLPSSLASDPSLKQVVSQTWEAGLRGRLPAPGGALTWNAGLFRTDLWNDIYGVATSLSAGYFQNVGDTRRQGVELGLRYRASRLDAYAGYSLVDATFQSAFTLPSPSNPFQDAQGNILVRPGDRLPGIPRHRFKAGADYRLLRQWTVGANLVLVSDQYYHGDEGNQLAPLPGYAVLNLTSRLDLTRRVAVFLTVDNALDAHYATFGVLGDPTGIGAPGIPPGAVANGPSVDNRFQSPASPLAAYGGLRMTF